jgi:hypothetical protein
MTTLYAFELSMPHESCYTKNRLDANKVSSRLSNDLDMSMPYRTSCHAVVTSRLPAFMARSSAS